METAEKRSTLRIPSSTSEVTLRQPDEEAGESEQAPASEMVLRKFQSLSLRIGLGVVDNVIPFALLELV